MADSLNSIGGLSADNLGVIGGSVDHAQFVAKWSSWLSGLDADASSRSRTQLVNAAGMVVASVERHGLAIGLPPGSVWNQIPFAEEALLTLVQPGNPPREVVSTYVHGPNFVGGAAEIRFKASVHQVSTNLRIIIEDLRHLVEPAKWGDTRTAPILRSATVKLTEARAVHLDQVRAPEPQRDEFRNVVRSFFRPLEIGGTSYEGINAAHDPASIALDFVLGTDDHSYRTYVGSLQHHLLKDDRKWLHQMSTVGSLVGGLAEFLGVRDIGLSEAVDAVRAQSSSAVNSVLEFGRLLRMHASVSGAHFAVIKAVLINGKHTESEITSPHLGTGGRPHDHTRSLLDMRLKAAQQVEALVKHLDVGQQDEGREVG